jgi:nicotinamide mononucleotide (NMN) deamidase PncC
MTSVVVNGATPFGGMSNQMVENIWAVDQAITRLAAAVAVAASGFSGTAGTEYETGSNFGVVPSSTPGAQGAAFAYAVNILSGDWATFRTAALASIEQLDNG